MLINYHDPFAASILSEKPPDFPMGQVHGLSSILSKASVSEVNDSFSKMLQTIFLLLFCLRYFDEFLLSYFSSSVIVSSSGILKTFHFLALFSM